MNKELEILNKIERVKTPPFLFTRIESKINELAEPAYSFKLAFSMSFILLILAIVNVGMLQNNLFAENKSDSALNTIVEEVSSSNQLYNE